MPHQHYSTTQLVCWIFGLASIFLGLTSPLLLWWSTELSNKRLHFMEHTHPKLLEEQAKGIRTAEATQQLIDFFHQNLLITNEKTMMETEAQMPFLRMAATLMVAVGFPLLFYGFWRWARQMDQQAERPQAAPTMTHEHRV